MEKIKEMSMEELVENLVDDVDENLEASDEVVIPTSWQEQETHRTIEVRAEEEEETMVDLGPIGLSEGRISEGGMDYGTNREVGEEEILSRVIEDEIINRGVIEDRVIEDEIINSGVIEDEINKEMVSEEGIEEEGN